MRPQSPRVLRRCCRSHPREAKSKRATVRVVVVVVGVAGVGIVPTMAARLEQTPRLVVRFRTPLRRQKPTWRQALGSL